MRYNHTIVSVLVFIVTAMLLNASVFGQLTYDRLSSSQIESLRKKADAGDVKAQSELGQRLQYGIGIIRDESLAADYLEKATEKDDIVAKAICYDEGYGTARDMTKAVEWYRKAAEKGDSVAQNNLGVCYGGGYGVDKDEAAAMRWYEKAANQGLAVAYANMLSNYEDDPKKLFELARKAADMGSDDGQAALGLLYLTGQGVEANPTEAIEWTRKADENKHPAANMILAISYANGIGVEKDTKEADRRAQRFVKYLQKNIRNEKDAIQFVEWSARLLIMILENPNELIQGLSNVDLSKCPKEFKVAYIDVVQGLRDLGKLTKETEQFQKDAEEAGVKFKKEVDGFNNQDGVEIFAESFLRGLLGDPLGKANELKDQENQLRARGQNLDTKILAEAQKLTDKDKKIRERISEALDKLERIVVMNDTHFDAFDFLRGEDEPEEEK